MKLGKQRNLMPETDLANMAEIVAIINCTPDSFSDDGLDDSFYKQTGYIAELAKHGITHLDIGAESTRPGATPISAEEEWQRLEPVLDWVHEAYPELKISVDSYHPSTIERSLKHNIDFINDVSGLDDDAMVDIAKTSDARIVLMHNLGVPAKKDIVLENKRPAIEQVIQWFERKLADVEKKGLSRNKLILDPGIGFGKTPEQNIDLIKNIAELHQFKLPIYVGHSRKSFLLAFTNALAKDRDIETYSVSQWLVEQGVSYIRVHDAIGHKRLLNTWQQIAT